MTHSRDCIGKQTLMINFLNYAEFAKWAGALSMWYIPICILIFFLSITSVPKYCWVLLFLGWNPVWCVWVHFSTVRFQPFKEIHYTLFNIWFIVYIVDDTLTEIHSIGFWGFFPKKQRKWEESLKKILHGTTRERSAQVMPWASLKHSIAHSVLYGRIPQTYESTNIYFTNLDSVVEHKHFVCCL